MYKYLLIVIGFFLVVGTGYFFYTHFSHTPAVACTMEAKLCPNGSSVGRSGPDCQFASCPTSATSTNQRPTNPTGILTGYMTISSHCSADQASSSPNCIPKPYSTILDISGAHNFFIELHATVSGMFFTPLPPGMYTLLSHSTSLYPSCLSQTVMITAGATTTADISCDSGIQ